MGLVEVEALEKGGGKKNFCCTKWIIVHWQHHKNVLGEDLYPLCRLCGVGNEAVAHIDVECPILAQKEYKQVGHVNAAEYDSLEAVWEVGWSGGFKRQQNGTCINQRKFYNQMVVRSYGTFSCRQGLENNRLDITAIDKKNKRC